MKVLIFTEIGKKIGFGHVVRCSTLYDLFSRKDYNVEFILNGDINNYKIIGNRRHKFMNWLDIDELSKLNIDGDTVAIIDSYIAKETVYQYISDNSKIVIYIDDNKRIEYPKGIVINPTLYGVNFDYPKKENIEYFVGQKYVLLRREFQKSKNKKINKNISDVMITLGGSDTTKEILDIVNTIYSVNSNYKINIIAGDNLTLDTISNDVKIYKNIEANEVKTLMLQSDLAISAGGQTLYELVKLGVPTIVYCMAENQRKNIESFKKLGIISEIKGLKYELTNELRNYEDYKYRKYISEKMITMELGKSLGEIVNWIGELDEI